MRKSTSIETGLSTVQSKRIEWLWPLRIPQNKLTLLVGDPGAGKSFVTLDIAARLSIGRTWPTGDEGVLGNTVVLGMEDDLEDTIKPRMEVLGGDPSRIIYIMGMKVDGQEGSRHPDLQQDLEAVRESVKRHHAKLVVVDPLSAYMGYVDTHKDSEVRQVLTPLAVLAKEEGVAVVGVVHLNKNEERDIIYRLQGSIGFVGVARMVHLIGKDKDNPESELRYMLPIKSNIKVGKSGLVYKLEDVKHPYLETEIARVKWLGEVEISPEEIVGPPPTDEEREQISEAGVFLTETLTDAGGHLAQEMVEKLARKAGISGRALKRAKAGLNITSVKKSSWWEWVLP